MRYKPFIVLVVLALAGLLPTQAFAGKPPKPGTANPEVTYTSGGKIYVCNSDASNCAVIYSLKSGYLRHPRMARDHRSVVFVQIPVHSAPPMIRRTTFSVTDGAITVTGTTTLFAAERMLWDVAVAPEPPQGTRFTVALETAPDSAAYNLYELDSALCSSLPCELVVELTPGGAARLLWSGGHVVSPIGGYNTQADAYFFQASAAPEGQPVLIHRVDLDNLEAGAGVIGEPFQSFSHTLDVGNLYYGDHDSRIVYGVFEPDLWAEVLHMYDTSSEVTTLLGVLGYSASWSPDDSEILFIQCGPDCMNWTYGYINRWNLSWDPGDFTPFGNRKWGADPDWAPMP